jgi:DNA-binding transcriptional LysR family regulator
MKFDVLGIEAFLSVAEQGSFSRAASHLNVSQTAVSHRLRKLEENLGLQLFNRTTRQVTLTEAGAELLPKARTLVRDFEQQVSLVCSRHRDMTEELSFACMPTIAVHILAPVFEEFKRRQPDARVRLFDKSATEIGETVSSGLAEFGIAILASNRWNLTSDPLFSDDYVCVSLVRFTPATANRIILDGALGARAERYRWDFEVQHTMTALMLVQSGLALALVPRLSTRQLPRSLAIVDLRGPRITRKVGLLRRRNEQPSRLAREFQDALRKNFSL